MSSNPSAPTKPLKKAASDFSQQYAVPRKAANIDTLMGRPLVPFFLPGSESENVKQKVVAMPDEETFNASIPVRDFKDGYFQEARTKSASSTNLPPSSSSSSISSSQNANPSAKPAQAPKPKRAKQPKGAKPRKDKASASVSNNHHHNNSNSSSSSAPSLPDSSFSTPPFSSVAPSHAPPPNLPTKYAGAAFSASPSPMQLPMPSFIKPSGSVSASTTATPPFPPTVARNDPPQLFNNNNPPINSSGSVLSTSAILPNVHVDSRSIPLPSFVSASSSSSSSVSSSTLAPAFSSIQSQSQSYSQSSSGASIALPYTFAQTLDTSVSQPPSSIGLRPSTSQTPTASRIAPSAVPKLHFISHSPFRGGTPTKIEIPLSSPSSSPPASTLALRAALPVRTLEYTDERRSSPTISPLIPTSAHSSRAVSVSAPPTVIPSLLDTAPPMVRPVPVSATAGAHASDPQTLQELSKGLKQLLSIGT